MFPTLMIALLTKVKGSPYLAPCDGRRGEHLALALT